MKTLSVVATPIGNLKDISLRALEVLGTAELILCEDTRMTRKLLSAYHITSRVESLHARSTPAKMRHVLDMLEKIDHIALVTDAGTPGISDPGVVFLNEARARFGKNIKIVAVPGACALTAALSISHVPVHDFVFLGFLPHKKGRQTLFQEIEEGRRAYLFYESPHRIVRTLQSLAQRNLKKKILLFRELTQMYEEILEGTAAELVLQLLGTPEKQKGEFTVVVSPQ